MSNKLTPKKLRDLILNEKRRLEETLETGNGDTEKTKADEVNAEDYAKTIIKSVDWMKALKIKESKLQKELTKIRAQKKALRQRIMESIEKEA